jgi:hypothetical protein
VSRWRRNLGGVRELSGESLNSPLVDRRKSGTTQDTLKPNRLQDEFSLIRSDLTLVTEAMVMVAVQCELIEQVQKGGYALTPYGQRGHENANNCGR